MSYMHAQSDDPHNNGYWAVLIDKNNQEQWYELYEDDYIHSHITTIATYTELYGVLDDPWEEYPDIPLFLVINGKHYGPAEDMEAVNIYNKENFAYNPLYNNNNRYALPVGFRHEAYNIGVDIDPASGDYRLFVQYSPLGDQEILCQTPSITYRTTNDAVIVTATSNEGVVRMTVDGEIVDNPYTITRGAEDVTVTVTAKARVYYKPESKPATLEITVPARDTTHDTGHWVVLIDKDGNEVWHELIHEEENSYLNHVALGYTTYGVFDPEAEERPNVCFNFSIDGVRYGAQEDRTPAIIGMAIDNPLFHNFNCYTVPVGYNYSFGVCYDYEGNPYAYVDHYSHVDEMGDDGKVASTVRYFNIMGQEIQEPEGLTIQVTTYTDGSTTAKKVFK